jgi:hypothetical protein
MIYRKKDKLVNDIKNGLLDKKPVPMVESVEVPSIDMIEAQEKFETEHSIDTNIDVSKMAESMNVKVPDWEQKIINEGGNGLNKHKKKAIVENKLQEFNTKFINAEAIRNAEKSNAMLNNSKRVDILESLSKVEKNLSNKIDANRKSMSETIDTNVKAISEVLTNTSKRNYKEHKIGDRVHLGFGAKGGAGFTGNITKFEGDSVHVKTTNGKTYKGPTRFLSKLHEEIQEVNEISQKTIENYQNKSRNSLINVHVDKGIADFNHYIAQTDNGKSNAKKELDSASKTIKKREKGLSLAQRLLNRGK